MTNLNFEHHLGSLTHAALSQASIISRVWGEGPSERYDELAKNFRPTFARIKEGALIREQHTKMSMLSMKIKQNFLSIIHL